MKPGNRRSKKQKEAKKMKQIAKKSQTGKEKERSDDTVSGKSTLSDASLEVLNQLFSDNSAEDILKLGPRPELLGMTPLAMAASIGNTDAVTKLLAAHADVNEKSNKNATALMQVTCSKNLEIAHLLLENGASLTETNKDGDNAFMLAVSTGDAKLVNKMWKYKKNLDINHSNFNGNTALHLAAEKKWDNCIQFLLLNGSDVNLQNVHGWTPLFTAVVMGDLKTVERIASAGSDLLTEDNDGNTVLCKAILSEKYDIANYLSKEMTDLEKDLYCNSRVAILQNPSTASTSEEVTQYYDDTLFPVLLHLTKYDHFRKALQSAKLIYHLLTVASNHANNSQIVSVSCFICTMLMFRYSSGTDDRFVKQFLVAEAPEFLMSLLEMFENSSGGLLGDPDVTSHCFMCLVPMTESAKGQAWIRKNALRLSKYVEVVKNMNVITAYNSSMDEGCKFKLKMMWTKFLSQYEMSIKQHREKNLASLLEEEEREKLLKEKKRDRRKLKKQNKKMTAMSSEGGELSSSGSCSCDNLDENNHSRHSSPSKRKSDENPSKDNSPRCDNLECDYSPGITNDMVLCISREYDESEWVKVGGTKKTNNQKPLLKPQPTPVNISKVSKADTAKYLGKRQPKSDKMVCTDKRQASDTPKSWADIAKGKTTDQCPAKNPISTAKQNWSTEEAAVKSLPNTASIPPKPVKQNFIDNSDKTNECFEYFQEFPSLNDKTETESIWGPYVQPAKNESRCASQTTVPQLSAAEASGGQPANDSEEISFGGQLDRELAEEIQHKIPPGFRDYQIQQNIDWWGNMEPCRQKPTAQASLGSPNLHSNTPNVDFRNEGYPNSIPKDQPNAMSVRTENQNVSHQPQSLGLPPASPTKISFGIDEEILRSLEKPKNPSTQMPEIPVQQKVVDSIVLNDGTVLNFNVPSNFVYENNAHHVPTSNSVPAPNNVPNSSQSQAQTPSNFASATMMDPFASTRDNEGRHTFQSRPENTYEGVTPPPKYPWPDRTQEYDDYMEQMWNSAMLLPSVFQLPKHLRSTLASVPQNPPPDTVLYPETLREESSRDAETSSDYSTQSSDYNDIFPSFHDSKEPLPTNFLFEELAKEQVKLQSNKISSKSLLKETVHHFDLDYYKSLYGLVKARSNTTSNESDSSDRTSPLPEWAKEPNDPDYEIQTMPRAMKQNKAKAKCKSGSARTFSNSGIISRRWKSKLMEITRLPHIMRRQIGDIVIPVQSAEYNINPTGRSVILGLLNSSGLEIAVKVLDRKQASINPKLISKLNTANTKHHFLLKYVAIEEAGNKLYLASELCDNTLEEYIHIVGLSHSHDPLSANKLSWQLLKGIHYIHTEFGISHGNIKPQNIFVDFDGKLCIGGYGVIEAHRLNRGLNKPCKKVCEKFWKATECLADSEDIEPTTASDVQVAGMLIYYILSGGKHPYGENPYEIEVNILQNWGQMAFISDEANDLISAMLFSDVSARPSIEQCLGHPFFWSDEKRFRLVLIAGSDVLKEMKTGMAVTGSGSTTMIDFLNVVPMEDVSQDWMSDLDPVVLKDMRSFRQYKNTLAELVLFLYNCCLHFDKMSPSAREVMDDPCKYFLSIFPNLFMAVYRAIKVSDRTNRTCYKPFYAGC